MALLAFLLCGWPEAVPAQAETRVALVIGNSAYRHVPTLANPKNDAGDMAAKLEGMGFEVVLGIDLDLEQLRSTVRKFMEELDGADLALFYYAGHGLQVDGVNYIAPVDASLRSYDDLEFEALSMDLVLSAMERKTKVNLVFLDACRDNPLADNLARSMGTRSGAVGRGLVRLSGRVGSLIAFATQPGNVALDGTGRNSPFTAALLKHLGTPGQGVMQDLVLVRRAVLSATGGKQVPWDSSSLTDEIILVPRSSGTAADAVPGDPGSTTSQGNAVIDKNSHEMELAFWNSIKDVKDADYFQSYLHRFPNGTFADLARLRIAEIAKQAPGRAGEGKEQETASLEPDQPTGSATCPRGQERGEDGQCRLLPSGLAVFDGSWELTRIANSAKICLWKSLTATVTIANGKISSEDFRGNVSKDGTIEITATFSFQGKTGHNIFKGRIANGRGTGKFYHAEGRCNGTFTLTRM